MSWGYQSYPYGVQQPSWWYQENPDYINSYDSWNQGPYLSEANFSYSSWPTTDKPNPPNLQNFDGSFPIAASEDVSIPPYQVAMDELSATRARIAQDTEDLSYIEEQIGKNTFQVASYEYV